MGNHTLAGDLLGLGSSLHALLSEALVAQELRVYTLGAAVTLLLGLLDTCRGDVVSKGWGVVLWGEEWLVMLGSLRPCRLAVANATPA